MKSFSVYFDEAGNTGDNLLDNQQPIHALASNNYNDEEIALLLEPLTNIVKATELHFVRLIRYKKYHKIIIDVLNHPLIHSSRIKYAYADKKFALICNLIDKLVEPAYFHQGINIYQKGVNICFSNALHFVGTHFVDKAVFDKFLLNFQTMVRTKTAESITAFYNSAEILNEYDNVVIEHLLPIVLATKPVIVDILDEFDKFYLDFTASTFVVLCDMWGRSLNNKFEVFHDNSDQIKYWERYIKTMSDDRITRTEVGFDYRKTIYPLLIKSITYADSKVSRQIQFSDLVASAVSYCVKTVHINGVQNDELANAILKSRIANKVDAWPIMPSSKFSPEELGTENDGGIDAVEFCTKIAGQYLDIK